MAIKMWGNLSEASQTKLRGTWLADHQAGLMLLSEQSQSKQAEILKMILLGQEKKPEANNVPDAVYLLDNTRLPSSEEKRVLGLSKALRAMEDAELNRFLDTNEDLFIAWYEARFGSSK